MKKANTIERILSAAEKEIALKGIDGARIESIAREAGVTKQLVYHYFTTKDQLYSAILESVSRGISVLSDKDVYQRLGAEDAIRHFVNAIFDQFIEHPSYAAFALDQALHEGEHISQSSRFLPTMRSYINEIWQPILLRGSERGELKSGLDADATFWMVFHLTTSCFLNEKMISETSGFDFNDEEFMTFWRGATINFILDALRAC
jgi:AcrR family transcriptional regulator